MKTKRKGNYGHKHSETTKKKLSEIKKGHTPWNKGLTKSDERVRRNCRNLNPKFSFAGRKHSEKTKKKMSEIRKGENSGFWKGGISKINNIVRHLQEYVQWRSNVYTRDNWTCQTCDLVGGELNAHHKISLGELLKEYGIKTAEHAIKCKDLWDVDNGITLCIGCHKQTESYLRRNN